MDIERDVCAEANGQASVDDLPELDATKLLGFRNLLSVTKPESDISETSNLAFTKKGESVTA